MWRQEPLTLIGRSSPPARGIETTEEEDIKEEAIEDLFLPPPLTAPAAIQTSRAERKLAPIMKASDAEKAPKRGTG
jgi:hypothetical protein